MAGIGKQGWGKAICLGLLLSSAAAAALAQQDAVQARRAAMKANGQALMHIDKIIRSGGDPAAVIGPANSIARTAADIPGLFPPGSGEGEIVPSHSSWAS